MKRGQKRQLWEVKDEPPQSLLPANFDFKVEPIDVDELVKSIGSIPACPKEDPVLVMSPACSIFIGEELRKIDATEFHTLYGFQVIKDPELKPHELQLRTKDGKVLSQYQLHANEITEIILAPGHPLKK